MLIGIVIQETISKASRNGDIVPSSYLLGQTIRCPLCLRELEGWKEGCIMICLYCMNCNLELITIDSQILDDNQISQLKSNLIKVLYSISSK